MTHKPNPDHIEIALKAAEFFARDGRLSGDAAQQLAAIALRDGNVGIDEVRVLTRIIGQLRPEEVTPEVREAFASLLQRPAAD